MKITELSAVQIAESVKTKGLSVKEVLQGYLEEISKKEQKLHCYITLDEEYAYAQAEWIQKKINAGDNTGILSGVPVAVKDNLCLEGMPATCASKMLENFMPPYTAAAVEKLKNAGAVILGKTNMDEFSMGNTTETSYFGPTKNPYHLKHVPGGSSGGSAAAVAAREACAALGTDTGGSIRQPASYCGVVGIKPTYGRVSRYGLIAYASSMDQIGTLASNVTDGARMLEAISGYDTRDATSIAGKSCDFSAELGKSVKGLRIGIPKDYLGGRLSSEVKDQVLRAVNVLKYLGAEIEIFELGLLNYAPPAYYVIAGAEASSNLARYDGVKFGYRTAHYDDLTEMYEKSRKEGLGEEVRRRIEMGAFTLSHGFYEDYYLQALKIRRLMKQSFNQAFTRYDVLLSPVSPTAAPELGCIQNNFVEAYWNDIYTVAANLAGLPAMSLPFGETREGLPIGVQLMGNCFEEKKLLRCAFALEQAEKGANSHGSV